MRAGLSTRKVKQWKSIVHISDMPRLPDLEAWAIFAKLAATGTFARTATELGLSKATVSKAIARLETRLGAALLTRTSRRLALTEIGRATAGRAAHILAEAEAMDAEARASGTEPAGVVRIAAPTSFAIAYLAPVLPELLEEYPRISVDLHLSGEFVDIVGDGFDLALRIATVADSTLRVRRFCQVRRLLVGSPTYFARHGRPTHPRDLAAHACLGYAHPPTPDRWQFIHTSGEEVIVTPSGRLRANNAEALGPALLAGMGLAVQPEFMMWADLAAGRLQAVMTDWSTPTVALNLLTPPGALRPARVTAVIDFLAQRLSVVPWAVTADRSRPTKEHEHELDAVE
jgi:DNA-binding transcriptional LysR family regulator